MIFNSLMSIGAGNIMVHCQFTFCIVCIYCYSDGSITLSMLGKYVIMLFLAKQLQLKSIFYVWILLPNMIRNLW